jgi:L-rhamnose mutarotase
MKLYRTSGAGALLACFLGVFSGCTPSLHGSGEAPPGITTSPWTEFDSPPNDSQTSDNPGGPQVRRFGAAIGVKPEKLDEYLRLHADAWPEVLRQIRQSNIRNYSIYLGKLDDDKLYLFSYFEYVGNDFEGDMAKMAADPKSQEWWKLTDPCQIPPKHRKPGEHWMSMREVFHTEGAAQ